MNGIDEETSVLIDTWWNVNSVQQLCYFPVSSFNRYMVECEFKPYCSVLRWSSLVLIDTWWNVNSDTVAKGLTDFRVLIDTWWNVNLF